MTVIVFIVAFLIIFSKFLDCWTTSTQITHTSQEKNPLARWLMLKFGNQATIWLVFVVVLIIVGILVWQMTATPTTIYYKIAFIIMGLIVSAAQFAVAHTNKTRKLNSFTRILQKIYR